MSSTLETLKSPAAAALGAVDTLEPRLLWKHFAALAAIPRGSKNEAAARAYVLDVADRLSLPARTDAVGNVVVTKPGTFGQKGRPAVVLQGHLDMVCEKNSATAHDFTKDPIRLVVDGGFLKADGTTLGADNGLGVAAALALLEADDLSHPPLECLFTIDEETGLTGANGLDPSLLEGRRMLNLDTEEEGAIYVGCAGGMDSVARTGVKRVPAPSGKSAFRIAVTGLRGGHSGVDIHEGRVNALKVLARVLWNDGPRLGLDVASIDGGSKRNAIAREAFAVVFVTPEGEAPLTEALAAVEAAVKAEAGRTDPGVRLGLAPVPAPETVMDGPDARRVVGFLYASLHGPLAPSPDIPGLVLTSTNLAIIETKGDEVAVSMSHRSSVESAKRDVGRQVAALCELAGFSVTQGDGYPGWAPNVSSPLLALAKKVHTDLFGREPEVKAIHAGLECGILGEKVPGMDTISFGPTIQNAHSPDERADLGSTDRFYRYLCALLAAM